MLERDGQMIATLEDYDAATPETRAQWRAQGVKMRKGDIRIIRERAQAEAWRIAFDMSYQGSQDFQRDLED